MALQLKDFCMEVYETPRQSVGFRGSRSKPSSIILLLYSYTWRVDCNTKLLPVLLVFFLFLSVSDRRTESFVMTDLHSGFKEAVSSTRPNPGGRGLSTHASNDQMVPVWLHAKFNQLSYGILTTPNYGKRWHMVRMPMPHSFRNERKSFSQYFLFQRR